jgi:hypothetical protein
MSTAPLHSKLPPSSASRWSVCTASVEFIAANAKSLPVQDWTLADEGSRAHEAARVMLTASGEPIFDNEEMKKHVFAYVRFCEMLTEPDDRVLTEYRVPLFYLPSERGTVDRAHFNSKRIYIADLKYGVGVSVEARNNKQLAIYAESLIRVQEQIEDIPDDMLVTLAIFQPRDRNNPEPVRLWVLTRGELREFTRKIFVAANTILCDGSPQFVPGPHCDKSFCPARGICKAYATQGLAAINADEAPVDVVLDRAMTVLPSLTREQRQRVIAGKSAMIKWLEEVENQEVAELMQGAPSQQFKLVEGKTNRQWADPDKATKELLNHLTHDQIYPPIPAEIISPAQAEKLVKDKAVITPLVTKPPGKPTLVPITDKRTALSFNPTEGLATIHEASEFL